MAVGAPSAVEFAFPPDRWPVGILTTYRAAAGWRGRRDPPWLSKAVRRHGSSGRHGDSVCGDCGFVCAALGDKSSGGQEEATCRKKLRS